MNLIAAGGAILERTPMPDAVIAAGIRYLVERTRRRLAGIPGGDEAEFAAGMDRYAIAEHVEDANAQHYELPAEFFELVLGPHRKYSSCLYPTGQETLAEAEALALAETVAHADLADGQEILELGCGWGSLSLWMAEHFPKARITSVSNSRFQRTCILDLAAKRGLHNLDVITADMNVFDPGRTFDRVVSVEMFEHMANWQALLGRVRTWLRPDGRLFLHVFSHKRLPYRFELGDKGDWIAQYFFTGGIMPSHGLIRQFGDLFSLEREWRWSGTHYERTALDWLANLDREDKAVRRIMTQVYGGDAAVWRRRWRMFFLATAGLFGHADGEEWGVSHYRLSPVPNMGA